MSVQPDVLAYHRDLKRINRKAAALVLRLWWQIDRGDISRSWLNLLPDVLAVVVAAQVVSAELADPYLTKVLDETAPNRHAVSPEGFAGPIGDVSLEQMLYSPVIDTKTQIATGASPLSALRSMESELAMLILTTIADTGRLSVSAGMGARSHATGYYRALTPPSCKRCAVQAGRWFAYNSGFKRHPRCFPAGVVVSGPTSEAATRRWFQGELVVLSTASGQNLSLTGNHPVLTSRGWVPANLLKEGDEVVRSTRPEGATPLVVPDHHQVPAFIEDVWSAFSVAGLDRMPTTPQDFHGDGDGGEVDIVYADRALRLGDDSTFFEEFEEQLFTWGLMNASAFDTERASQLLDLWRTAHAGSTVGSGGLSLSFGGGHLAGSYEPGLTGSPALNACLGESFGYDVSRNTVLLGQGILARSGQVGVDNGIDGEVLRFPRWDAPGDPFSMETTEGYTALGRDLLNRLSGQVELDCVVELRRVDWSGHVYSLTSSEGWHVANSLIVSNCDCVHIPVRDTDDSLRFDARRAIEAGQVKGLSKADTRAILEFGADPSQVINASKGMFTAGGRTYTRTGTSRRGIAGARILARDIERALGGLESVQGRTFRNMTFSRTKALEYAELFRKGTTYKRVTKTGRAQTYAFRYSKSHRPTPETILATAKSREEAIRLLINNGYIL